MIIDLCQVGTQCTSEKALEFYTLCTSSKVEVGSTRNNRVPIDIIKASAFRRQAKRRCLWVGLTVALRLVDLAALTFRFCEASAIAQGVEGIFGCTASKVATQNLLQE